MTETSLPAQSAPHMTSSGGLKISFGPAPLRAKALSHAGSSTPSGGYGGWLPALSPPNADQAYGRRDLAVARGRDLQANDPLAAGGVDKMVSLVVGQVGLRFSSAPDAETLGLTQEEASELGAAIERVWRLWAEDTLHRCDFEECETFGGLSALLAHHEISDGEAVAVLRWDNHPRNGFLFRTSVQVIDPDRLSNPNNTMDTATLRGGVETDGRRPVAYHIRDAHPYDVALGAEPYTWKRVPKQESWGRPIVLHYFRKRRAGQVRGWSRLMSTLQQFKGLSRYANSEIEANAIRALLSAVLYSDNPGEAGDALDLDSMEKLYAARTEAYGEKGFKFADGARIPALFPTDRLELLNTERTGQDFEKFVKVFARSIASAIGLSYEQFSQDYSSTNYSSMRAALLDVYRGVKDLQALKVQKINAPLLLAVLEDAVDSGVLTLPPQCPDLYACPAAYTAGRWLGPPKGWVDPVKEALGAAARIENGLSTLERETAEQGGDWREDAIQRRYEMRFHQEIGLPLPIGLGDQAAATDASQEGPESGVEG
ncbi:MAG: phage portal protein [Pseudomonadota bacterium]